MKNSYLKRKKNECLDEVNKIPKILLDAGKDILLAPVSGITPTNNEIKYALKVYGAL